MVPLILVRPILQSDVLQLQAEFIHGYKNNDKVFYVFTINDKDCQMQVSNKVKDSWDPDQMMVNNVFEEALSKNEDLVFLCDLMFFV